MAHTLGKGGGGSFQEERGLRGWLRLERERHSRPEDQSGQTSKGENEHPACVCRGGPVRGVIGGLGESQTQFFHFLGEGTEAGEGKGQASRQSDM